MKCRLLARGVFPSGNDLYHRFEAIGLIQYQHPAYLKN